MAETPVSYKDPTYATLDAKVTEKLGLPDGLLASIRTKGERSNADQVSEAGAKSVYQIIPATRDAVLKKYGIDAYLNPENAAETAGLLLKEGLDRNKGDPALAVAEYIGGTDRANWGPVTRAYVARVAGGLPAPKAPAPAPAAPQSTYDKVLASTATPEAPAMATVFNAYQSGQMSPEDAATFEGEVKSGRVMLPRGATLKTDAPAAGAPAMPDALAKAYQSGQMDPADRAQLEELIKTGVVAPPKGASQIPGVSEGAPTNLAQRQADPTLGQRIVGTGEAAVNLGTGLVGGTLGAAGGAASGLYNELTSPTGSANPMQAISNAAESGAQALTYAPRTDQGQAQAGAVGNVLANTAPLMGHGGEMAAIGQLAKPTAQVVAPVVRNTVGTAAQNVAAGVRNAVPDVVANIPGQVREMVRGAPDAPTPTPGTMGSVGAMGVDMATQRRMNAADLPAPIELTKGQAERTFEQQRFERETAKDPNAGAPLRERFAEQNQQVLRNFDAWVDQTGAEAPDLRSVGSAVDKALVAKSARDKTEINVKYAAARRSPESKAAVDQAAAVTIGEGENAITSTPLAYINEQPTGLPSTAVTDAARQYATRLGVADLVDGELVPRPTTIANMEAWRKSINESTGYEPVDIRHATILKKLIDGQTEPVAGPLYRDARNARARYAEQYEDRAVIADLLGTKKGTSDRKVALEDVFDRSILRGSLDDVRTVRKVLQTGDEGGKQAWKELQGQTVNYIKDQATKNVARDTRGNQIVSAAGLDKAIRSLDADGKLDFVFGKKGAEQMRAINDLAKDIYTAPPGAVNSSNTASVLLAAMDMAISGAGGMPLPVMSGLRMVVNNVKDRRIRTQVSEALGTALRKDAAKPQPIRVNKKTIH